MSPTFRQKKLAKVIIENSTLDKPLNGGEMVEKVGYAKSLVDYPKKVIETEGVQKALADLGFSEEGAMKVVEQIMYNPEVDANARLKATDQVFKVRGSYAPEKSMSLNVNVNAEVQHKANKAIQEFVDGDDRE